MNIKKAKDQIKNAIQAYFTKDKNGEYMIPVEKQRPVFLMGPPGIGKTAIMEQVAAEMGVGLLSYSMTHHTRQSALGLPFIEHKNYSGLECDVSEYTMSEIIASIYDLMEETGVKEGILFLDEINCVSETLAPIMLQFLQYKVFGRHRVPDGWIVVTAGNPPEYNNSVREFDIVTWDRLKRVDVEPDFDIWKEYAYNHDVHPAIMTYLDIKKSDFYQVGTTVDGKSFVTARGWDDLSKMIRLYELNDIIVDEDLISQYLRDKKIAKSFSVYYDLFLKYRSHYQVGSILAGKASQDIRDRAEKAKFDERLSLLGLILDALNVEVKGVMDFEKMIALLLQELKIFKQKTTGNKVNPTVVLQDSITKIQNNIDAGRKSGNISRDDISINKELMNALTGLVKEIADVSDGAKAFAIIKKEYDGILANLQKASNIAGEKLSNAFIFIDEVFGGGQEMLIMVTELTANANAANFISRYGCEEYFKHNKDLLLYERNKELTREIDELDID